MKRIILILLLISLIGAVSAVDKNPDVIDTTTAAGYIILIWNTVGNGTYDLPAVTADLLIVGSGGGARYSGGGGGYVNIKTGEILESGTWTIVVPAGGLGHASGVNYTDGAQASLTKGVTTYTANGGKKGVYHVDPDGGSGGGSYAGDGGSGGNGGTDGGNGGDGTGSDSGYGGTGQGTTTTSAITGTSVKYGAGGAGGSDSNAATGGADGGGNAGNPGTAGTNYGAGGGGNGVSNNYGGKGYKGIIVVKYLTPPPPVASFTSNATSGLTPPDLAVQFNDTSYDDPTAWNWSYTNTTPGDNIQVWWSQVQNATHTFGNGNWKINLNVTNAFGFNVSTANYWINVSPGIPVAAFHADDTTPVLGQVVSFTDDSTRPSVIDSWYWEFGDGNTSTAANPTNSYYAVGSYNVNLKVTNGTYGSTWNNKTNYITTHGPDGFNQQDLVKIGRAHV